jgi:hypothetical protein
MSRPPQLAVLGIWAALAFAGAAACRRPPGPHEAPNGAPPAPRGVGWTMPDDSAVRRGTLLSTPAGREDALVPVVAGASTGWVAACASARGSAARATFSVDVPAATDGAPVAGERSVPYERCLASRAVATLAAAKTAPRGTAFEITLELR